MLVKIKVPKRRFLLLFLLAFCLVTTFIVLVTCLAVLIPRNKDSSSSKSHEKPVSTGSIGTAPPAPSDGISTTPSVTVDPQSSSEDGGENFLENSNEVPTQEETSTEPPTVLTETNVQSYVCPKSYAYISYEDARNFQDMICANNTYSGAFRVEEGGSVSCANGFSALESDPRVLDQAICVKTTYSNPQKVSHTNLECPVGLARASLEEAKVYIKQLCPKLGKWDILRVGVQGAFYGPGYGCKLYDWYTGSVTDVLCIKRQVIDMTFGPANEGACGNNRSLYTVQEALSNSEELCAKIPEDGNVRLAGGSAMYGTGNDCMIIDVDRDSIGQAFCGPIPRN